MRNYVVVGRPQRHSGAGTFGTPFDTSNVLPDRAPTPAERVAAWPNALPARQSPCRHDRTKGVRQHRCSRAHAELVAGYRAIREAEDAAAEAATNGYDTELAEYWRDHPRVTFRDYLTHQRQEH